MNALDFISSVIKSAIWPCVAVFAILVFSTPLKEVIASLKEVFISKDGFSVKFNRETQKNQKIVREVQIEAAAKLSPSGRRLLDEKAHMPENVKSIVSAWNSLEETVRKQLKQHGSDVEALGVSALLESAYDQSIITDNEYKSLLGLSTMRNLAVYSGPDEIDGEKTRDFLNMADAIKNVLYMKSISGKAQ
jgi:hypothetical protein